MNKAFLFPLIAIIFSCTVNPLDVARLDVGTCYHTYGDVGGSPDIVHCVQSVGKDGFLRCQGSSFGNNFSWYACNSAESWRYLSRVSGQLRKVECPKQCPILK